MLGFVAKALCPDLIFLPIDMPKYVGMSRRVMDIFKQYDPNMLVAGCDEGYLKSETLVWLIDTMLTRFGSALLNIARSTSYPQTIVCNE